MKKLLNISLLMLALLTGSSVFSQEAPKVNNQQQKKSAYDTKNNKPISTVAKPATSGRRTTSPVKKSAVQAVPKQKTVSHEPKKM